MTVSASFAKDYVDARGKFRDAVTKAGGTIASYGNPGKGPAGEDLATDIAWFGPRAASRVLVTMSATHGVEGFCGSGIQVASLEAGFVKELPADTALLVVHALNPYGFAWIRRVTEENVDLNRNFVDHASAPANPGYDALADAICPAQWDDTARSAALKQLQEYAAEHGAAAL